jgi:ATP-GRASP peptide maturase of grasp-with-spasm system
MILIITDTNDQSTCHVIDWLRYMQQEYFIVTEKDRYDIISLDVFGDFAICINENTIIHMQEITSVWYRRGSFRVKCDSPASAEIYPDINAMFNQFYRREINGLSDFVNYILMKKKNLNNELFSTVNKLVVLNVAIKVGLTVPESIVTTKKAILLDFMRKHKQVITKSAIGGLFFDNEEYCFNVYTELVTSEMIDLYSNTFSPSFFQEFIAKQFEIRVFYLEEECYSMAIFSQANSQTQIDFRHYDKEKPNRSVPFELPPDIKTKIIQLMKCLHINSGSLDIIYGTDKNFYFLEINPIGQFGMVSYPCNYYLEKKIAEYLAKR